MKIAIFISMLLVFSTVAAAESIYASPGEGVMSTVFIKKHDEQPRKVVKSIWGNSQIKPRVEVYKKTRRGGFVNGRSMSVTRTSTTPRKIYNKDRMTLRYTPRSNVPLREGSNSIYAK